jgi:hypothetical protein
VIQIGHDGQDGSRTETKTCRRATEGERCEPRGLHTEHDLG